MKYIICHSLLLLFATTVAAQSRFSGSCLDMQTNHAINGMYVENANRNRLTHTDTSGSFSIQAEIGDTLVFSAIGYEWAKYVITNYNFQTLHFEQHIYNLQQVVKYAPREYETFKYQIVSMDFLNDSLHQNIESNEVFSSKPPETFGYTIEGPITALYNAFSKRAQNEQRAQELFAHKYDIIVINNKISKEFVMDLLKMPEENFNDFMVFCSFSDEFLVKISEYDLAIFLFRKYEEFLRLRS
ncbi:MAG: carboxypeptidase-like regulatory domain-containing protein [Bacteroidales bacterium]|jgi:hypothetical protein|nr:carboxypeptidase-like regulatory domain-containing protein [Bacteroidales bacterium]